MTMKIGNRTRKPYTHKPRSKRRIRKFFKGAHHIAHVHRKKDKAARLGLHK